MPSLKKHREVLRGRSNASDGSLLKVDAFPEEIYRVFLKRRFINRSICI